MYLKYHYYCDENPLTTLKGAPQVISGTFSCENANLKSLIDGPQKVGRNFIVEKNKLYGLYGGPQEVGGNYHCDEQKTGKLRDFTWLPAKLGGELHCNHITSKTIIPAKSLPALNRYEPKVRYIDWKDFHRSILDFRRWIPLDSRIRHINLTPKQHKELQMLSILQV